MLPADDADALDWLAFEQAGVLTTAQVSGLLSEGTVRGRIRSGRWRSICRGVLLTGNGRLNRDQQLWVAVLAAGPGAMLAGVTAATEAGVRGLRREPLHVLVPAVRRAARTSLRRLPIDMPAVLCIARRCCRTRIGNSPVHHAPRRPEHSSTRRDGPSVWTRRRECWRPVVSSGGCCPRSCRRCSTSSPSTAPAPDPTDRR